MCHSIRSNVRLIRKTPFSPTQVKRTWFRQWFCVRFRHLPLIGIARIIESALFVVVLLENSLVDLSELRWMKSCQSHSRQWNVPSSCYPYMNVRVQWKRPAPLSPPDGPNPIQPIAKFTAIERTNGHERATNEPKTSHPSKMPERAELPTKQSF